jgi:hypothetical protein
MKFRNSQALLRIHETRAVTVPALVIQNWWADVERVEVEFNDDILTVKPVRK